MTNAELFAKVKATGLLPLQVRSEEGSEASSRTFLDGDLDQFLAAAKEIGAKVIFIEPTALEDWLFTYNPAEENEDDPNAPDEDVDLSSVAPSLAKYKRYIGEHYTFFLSAKGGVADLNFILDQEWVEHFEDEIVRAQEEADLQLMTSKIRRDKGNRN